MLFFGDRYPRIAIGRMQPATAEVERKSRPIDHCERPPAKPRTRFDEKASYSALTEALGRRDSGGPATDNHRFKVVFHFRECWVAVTSAGHRSNRSLLLKHECRAGDDEQEAQRLTEAQIVELAVKAPADPGSNEQRRQHHNQ